MSEDGLAETIVIMVEGALQAGSAVGLVVGLELAYLLGISGASFIWDIRVLFLRCTALQKGNYAS